MDFSDIWGGVTKKRKGVWLGLGLGLGLLLFSLFNSFSLFSLTHLGRFHIKINNENVTRGRKTRAIAATRFLDGYSIPSDPAGNFSAPITSPSWLGRGSPSVSKDLTMALGPLGLEL